MNQQNCDLLNKTDKLNIKLRELESKLSKSEYINDETFNEMIDILVNCIDKIQLINNMNADFYIEKTSDNIVKVIELVNNGMESKIRPYISNSIIILSYLRKLILNLDKKNIIIIGINEYSKYMNEIIDFNKANILAYVSMNNIISNLNSEFIISKEEITQFDADYYILMDEIPSDIDLDSKQIINFWEYLRAFYFQSPEFSVRFNDYMLSEKDYDGIITGLSYTELGIDEKILNNNFVNLANPAQDIFYDFEMFKYGLEQCHNIFNIKYCIIGLCLYSFDYDLSLSVNNQHRSIYYYPVVKSMHNYIYRDAILTFINDFETKSKQVFVENSHSIIFNKYKEKYKNILKEGRKKQFKETDLSEDNLRSKLDYIEKEFVKDYPETRKENEKIFRDYLHLLKEHDIKTYVVIPPLSKFYVEHIPGHIRYKTIDIIHKVQQEYNFCFIDFSDKPFKDEYFTDGSHLNLEGSRVFTELLNQYIL